jgi:Ca2+-binding RTX toxin-like protein
MSFLFLLGAFLWLPLLTSAFNSEPDGQLDPQDPEPSTDPINFFGSNGDDVADGSALNDTLRGFNGSDDLFGNGGDDALSGGNGFDFIFGGDGNDTLSGNGGGDQMGGDAGDDLLFGGGSNDFMDGGNGNDTLYGGNGNDFLFGDEYPRIGTADAANGNDLLVGGNGFDRLAGNGGLDTFIGGLGNDTILDYDLALYDGPNASLVDGGAGNDRIFVDGGSTITGGTGEDLIYIFQGLTNSDVSEVTDFNPDEDRLEFEIEVDETDSGALRLVDFADGTGAEVYYGDILLARVTGAQGLDPDEIDLRLVLRNDTSGILFEDGPTDTEIISNAFDNTIRGGGGDDTIIAGGFFDIGAATQGGRNLLDGGNGNDFISAGGGSPGLFFDEDGIDGFYVQDIHPDTLIGGAGDDTLLAENGGQITGGRGADVIGVSQSLSDAALGYPYDPVVITDFDTAEDVLFVDVRPQYLAPGGIGAITVEIWEDGTGSDVLLDGSIIAQVTGGQTLTPSAITTNDAVIFS